MYILGFQENKDYQDLVKKIKMNDFGISIKGKFFIQAVHTNSKS
jgi:hypothetical protein